MSLLLSKEMALILSKEMILLLCKRHVDILVCIYERDIIGTSK